jgi:hypothetical protein
VQVEGRSLRNGIEFLARTVAEPGRWIQATQIEQALPLAPALPVMLMARRAYGNDFQDRVLDALHRAVPDDVSWLLWPRS